MGGGGVDLVAKENVLKCFGRNTLGGVACTGKEASSVLTETVVSGVAAPGTARSQTVDHTGDHTEENSRWYRMP